MFKHLLLISYLMSFMACENPLEEKSKTPPPQTNPSTFQEVIPLALIGGLTLQKKSDDKNLRLIKVDLPFNHNKRDLLQLLAIRHTILPQSERELSWEQIQSSNFIDLGLKYHDINNAQETTDILSLTLKGDLHSGKKVALILYHPLTLKIAHTFDGLVTKGSDQHLHQIDFILNNEHSFKENLSQHAVAIQVKNIEWPQPDDYYQLTILRPKHSKQYFVSKSLKPMDFLKQLDADIDYQKELHQFMSLKSDHLFKYTPKEWDHYKDRGMWVIAGHADLMTVPDKSVVLIYFSLRDGIEASLVEKTYQHSYTVDETFSLPNTHLFERVEINLQGTYQVPVLKYIPEHGAKGDEYIMGSLRLSNGQTHQVHFSVYSYSHHDSAQAITNWGEAPYLFSRLHDKWIDQHPFEIQKSQTGPTLAYQGIDWDKSGNAFYFKLRQEEKRVQLNGALHPDYHHLKNLSGTLHDRFGKQLASYNGYSPTILRSKDRFNLTFTTYFSALRN